MGGPIRDFLALTAEEQAGIWALVAPVRRSIESEWRLDGYNIGINVGESAGQTVAHAHLHVIPRYRGDGSWSGLVGPGTRTAAPAPQACALLQVARVGQLVEQGLCLSQVGRVRPFGEPAVDLGE